MRDNPEVFKNGAAAETARPPAIVVSGLSKRVADASGELTILQNIDFTVQAAETLALVEREDIGAVEHDLAAGTARRR